MMFLNYVTQHLLIPVETIMEDAIIFVFSVQLIQEATPVLVIMVLCCIKINYSV